MSKFLILSIFLHTILASVFTFKKFLSTTKDVHTISVAYIDNKDVKSKKEKIKEISKKSVKEKPKKIEKKKKAEIKDYEKKEKNLKKKDAKEKTPLEKDKSNFDDMLKNLADKELVQNKEDSYNIDKKIESLSEKNLENKDLLPDKKELLTIANILRSQIDNNWTRPPGIKNIENLSFKLIISLDPNGNVINIKVPLRTENLIKKNVFLKPYLNSAIRAIKKTSPFEGLEKHRYNIWKSNIINFIPYEAN